MNELQLKILNTLMNACDDPIVRQSTDVRLKAHLADIGMLAGHLLTELRDLPALRRRAMGEFAAIAPEIERLLTKGGGNGQAIKQLIHVDETGDAACMDACFEAARTLQLELHRIQGDASRALGKRLALIEGDYSKRVIAALSARTSRDSESTPVVGQTRDFDRAKLGAFIVRSFPQETELRIEDIKFISGGSSKYTMAIRLAGVRELPGELILRGDSASSVGFGGCSVTDEYRLLKIMHPHGVRVAKPLAAEPTGDVFGSPFMLVERRPGAMIGHMFNLPAPNLTTCRDVAAGLAAIHRIPLSAISDWIRGAGVSTSEQVAATLEQSYDNWQALKRPSPLFESAFKWLRDNVAVMDRSRGLVHGDYGLHNILIDNERVSAILDWEFAHIGNPAYDLGYFYYMAQALGSWEEFLDAYRQAGGPTYTPEELDYSILFAVTRLGVMLCQAEAAYRAGVTDGIFIALITARNCHNQTLKRIHGLLERIL